MADLPEQELWEGVRQLETSDRALGGPGGVMNAPLRNLTNRTAHLKKVLEGKTGAASTTNAGIVKLSSAVDSLSANEAATSAAVKTAYDTAIMAGSNANSKLSKNANLSDISNVSEALQNLGLVGMVVPVGVPLPWPASIPPSGWLKCNGASFNKSQYPQLATVYPSGTLPDLRGEFIRGWDDGRGVNTGRQLLSTESQAIQHHIHDTQIKTNGTSIQRPGNAYNVALHAGAVGELDAMQWMRTTETYNTVANETRPRNIAFLYIVRAE